MIEQIGPHRIKNGNLLDGIDDLMQGQKADIFFGDPPWGAGNLKYWETLRLKHTGTTARRDNPQDKFLASFFDIARKYSKGPVIVAYGEKWADEVIACGRSAGLTFHITVETLYRSGSKLLPMHCHIFGNNGWMPPQGYAQGFVGTADYNSIQAIIKPLAVNGGVVLDPCCGLGLAAKAAVESGMVFYGNEMNPKRLETTKKRFT